MKSVVIFCKIALGMASFVDHDSDVGAGLNYDANHTGRLLAKERDSSERGGGGKLESPKDF